MFVFFVGGDLLSYWDKLFRNLENGVLYICVEHFGILPLVYCVI